MLGNDDYGSSYDDTIEWSKSFNGRTYDLVLFTTNDFSKFVIFDKLTIAETTGSDGEMKTNIRSSANPNSSGTSFFKNEARSLTDPQIALTN